MSVRSSSFYWAMRLMPKEERRAMFAVYEYCRCLDDIADGNLPIAEKSAKLTVLRGALSAWSHTGIALHPILAQLAPYVQKFNLPVEELGVLIDGMEQDVLAPLIAPERSALSAYCRQAAGSVGVLCIHILGRPDAKAYALLLAEALQLTNILRDVAEDAELGRLYLPRECLDLAKISTHTPKAALSHPALPAACTSLGRDALSLFAGSQTELKRIGGRNLRPAAIMGATYKAQLDLLMRNNCWDQKAPRLGKIRKLAIALGIVLAGA